MDFDVILKDRLAIEDSPFVKPVRSPSDVMKVEQTRNGPVTLVSLWSSKNYGKRSALASS